MSQLLTCQLSSITKSAKIFLNFNYIYRKTHHNYAVKVENAAVLPSPSLCLIHPICLKSSNVLEPRNQTPVRKEVIAQRSLSRSRVLEDISVVMEL